MINSPTSSSYSGVEARPLGLGALMISSLGRMTLGSLGFGSSLEYRLPPLHTNSVGKLVQVSVRRKLYTQGRWSKTNTSIFLQVLYIGFFFVLQVGSGNSSPVSQTANPARRSSLHQDPCGAGAAEGMPNYPKFKKSREKFVKECAEAKSSGDYAKLIQFYGTAFQNFANMNAVFKASSFLPCSMAMFHFFWG